MIFISDKVRIKKTKYVGKVIGVERDKDENYLIVEFGKNREMVLPESIMEEVHERDK